MSLFPRGLRSSRRLASVSGLSAIALTVSGLALTQPALISSAAAGTSGSDCISAATASGGADALARQRAFEAAAASYGVPVDVLLGVSYLESRWDDHGARPSTSGGYGPMHLTDVRVPDMSGAKGDGSLVVSDGPESLHTAERAAELTGLSVARLTTDDLANICGGAAVLASYQKDLRQPIGSDTAVESWYDAVARYSWAVDAQQQDAFATRVFSTIKQGESRVTNDGQQLTLSAHAALRMPTTATATAGSSEALFASESQQSERERQEPIRRHCPRTIVCEIIPAPYEHNDPTDPGAYGNHDLADRPRELKIDYIIIHDTETSYDGTIRLVTDPTYLSWQYTLRSSDGHIAQHMNFEDVGWHAGNWYVNAHSIGLEHEGFAADGAAWYTEAMYQTSAALVKYLARKHHIPLDRAHIIGHDQIPGTIPATIPGMHWDPGPYWDWEHYFELLDRPITARGSRHTDVWTVKPGFDDNQQEILNCDGPGTTCEPQGSNFVYVHTAPDESSPLVKDVGLRPGGENSTKVVSDIGARLAAGQQVVVDRRVGDWAAVWYLGDIGWVYSPRSDPNLVPSRGKTVSIRSGAEPVPVYGRAYPEPEAYEGTGIPVQSIVPLPYTIKPGQEYVLADKNIETDYYRATTFAGTSPGDWTDVEGEIEYYEIWFGHRMHYVMADDVRVRDGHGDDD
jgi:N-acetyl-anhydromuramyl-L-alanine amidase AmpD